ncbi:tyrosine-type recombinase/integrase [Muricoccus radiodurans]|uniref:tyrosine-type recombinase/integrase n=1 Tax=Muricoccus radiodurans TaxID=2231721 RepID=UPI003CEB67A9
MPRQSKGSAEGPQDPGRGPIRLDDRTVAALTCPPGRKDMLVFDAEQAGFGVRVEAKGRRTFLFQYNLAGAKRRLPLGVFGEVTAAQARKLAQKYRGTVVAGGDPWGEQKAKQVEAVTAEKRAALQAAANAFTVRRLIEDWDRLHLAHKRFSYRRDALSRMNQHLAPILDTPTAMVTKAQAVACVDRAAENGGETTARRVQSYARAMFGWARGRGMLDANPFEGVPAPGKEIPRERVLTPEEVGLIWRAAGKLPHPYGPFVRFLLLTLQRREEVAGITDAEISADGTTWVLPGARAKNGKPHTIHLAPASRQILGELQRSDTPRLVFGVPSLSEAGALNSLTTFAWIRRQLDLLIEAERRETTDGKAPPLPHWTFHDFRRSGVTWLSDAGFPPHVADRILNHVQGTIRGVAAIYQRAEFLPERRAALEAWAAHVVACGEGQTVDPKVVPIATKRAPRTRTS